MLIVNRGEPIEFVFAGLHQNPSPESIENRTIVTATNNEVAIMSDTILDMLPGDETYLSVESEHWKVGKLNIGQ